MRVLVLSVVEAFGPDAPKGGAVTVTRGLIDHWQKTLGGGGAEITLVANPALTPRQRLVRQLASIAEGAVTGRSSKIVFQENDAFKRRVERALLEERWDLVVANGSDLFDTLRRKARRLKVTLPPAWVVVHNVESDLFADQVAALPGLLRPVFAADLRRLREAERETYRAADRIICICEEDHARLAALYPDGTAERVVEPVRFPGEPYSARQGKEPRAPGAPLRLGMLGDFGWWPNADGLDWFLREVWGHLPETVELHLFGDLSDTKAPPGEARIHGYGMVESLDQVWSTVDLMVCPVRYGAGVRIKNAEALWNGVPIITNALGMRGVDRSGSAPALVREDAADWISVIRDMAAGTGPLAGTTTDTPASHGFCI